MPVGVASTNAHGQATMSTLTARMSRALKSPPEKKNVARPGAMTVGTNHTAHLSARWWTAAFFSSASSTRWMILPSVESPPTAVTRTSNEPTFLIQPNQ